MSEHLDEMKVEHDSNFDEIESRLKETEFKSLVYARQFRMHAVNIGIKALGFNPMSVMNMCTTPETAASVIDSMLEKHGIRIEDWADTDQPNYKKGIYLYKSDEIAYFVSTIRKHEGLFYVRTNVKMK